MLVQAMPYPGVSVATDPNFSSVKLLIGANGTSGSTAILDESGSPHTLTAAGNAQISTSGPKFGSGSLLFDGSGDDVTSPNSADWQFGAGDFTIEMFVNFASLTTASLIGLWQASGTRSWQLVFNTGPTPDLLQFYTSTGGATSTRPVEPAWAPSTGTWYHVAVDRSGNDWRIYVDGVMLAKNTVSQTLFASTAVLSIGQTAATQYFNGKIDEVRITKGVARYASDAGFTVPTAAFPRS